MCVASRLRLPSQQGAVYKGRQQVDRQLADGLAVSECFTKSRTAAARVLQPQELAT